MSNYYTKCEADSTFLKEHQDISGKADKSELFSKNYNDLTNKPTLFDGDYNNLINKPTIPDVSSFITMSDVESKNYLIN